MLHWWSLLDKIVYLFLLKHTVSRLGGPRPHAQPVGLGSSPETLHIPETKSHSGDTWEMEIALKKSRSFRGVVVKHFGFLRAGFRRTYRLPCASDTYRGRCRQTSNDPCSGKYGSLEVWCDGIKLTRHKNNQTRHSGRLLTALPNVQFLTG